jgi:AhpD family alkylhydroperoxidase
MERMSEVEWEAPLLESSGSVKAPGASLSERLAQQFGGLTALSAAPWILEHSPLLQRSMFTRRYFDHELADMVGLVVSQDNSCRYCFAAQRSLLRVLGFPQERITQLEQDLRMLQLEPKERAALEFARRLSRSSPLLAADDTKPLLDAGFSREEVAELVAQVAVMIYFNRISTLPAFPPEAGEALPDRLWLRAIRPIAALLMRNFRKRETPEPLTDSERKGPFAARINALDGIPAARALRGAVDACFASDILTARAKALVFAVVARALGDRGYEREATELATSGGLEAADIAEILGHLASPALDDVERIVVPFARETVWYRPIQIQRRAREVQQALRADEFTELIAVASLANALGRLGLLVRD